MDGGSLVVHLPMATVLPPEEGEAEGCVQCPAGSKLVLFVTGKCRGAAPTRCPKTAARRPTCSPTSAAADLEEVIEEGRAMNATGAGITGGERCWTSSARWTPSVTSRPLLVGPPHPLHLDAIDAEVAGHLAEAGLDELRFHLLELRTTEYVNSITAAAQAGITTGVELPCEPDKAEPWSRSCVPCTSPWPS